jgi:hypothetical protein
MHPRASHAAFATPLLMTACATMNGTPLPMTTPTEPRSPEFQATGELRSSVGNSAAFDGWRVVGPQINLTRNADGSWNGTAGPAMTAFHLHTRLGEVHGTKVAITVSKGSDGSFVVGGLFFDERYTIRLSTKTLTGSVRGGRCAFELKRVSPELYAGDVACGREVSQMSVEFRGGAARVEDPILPQLALALLAVLPDEVKTLRHH